MEDKRYAVLIDSDNISSKYISSILDEMTKYGVVTYKRIYGDWTSSQANKWKTQLMENSITPIQQFRNTVGKNATDSTLIIDAMDIRTPIVWMASALYPVMVILQGWPADFVSRECTSSEWVRIRHLVHSELPVQYSQISNFSSIKQMIML